MDSSHFSYIIGSVKYSIHKDVMLLGAILSMFINISFGFIILIITPKLNYKD